MRRPMRPASFEQTIAGIDNVMAMRPAHVETGMNVTIVRCNVDHLMPLTELAIAKGFSKINFQFTTPFGRAYDDVVPPLDETGRAVMRGHRPLRRADPHPRDQRAVLRHAGLRTVRRRRSAEARTHHGLRRRSALPRAGQPLRVVGRAAREARRLHPVPVDHGVRGVPGVRAGEAGHARRARAAGGGGRLSDERSPTRRQVVRLRRRPHRRHDRLRLQRAVRLLLDHR